MKIAVVTGASSGIGREFVRQIGYFYKSLDEIWVIARRKERLEQLREQSRIPLRIIDGDLLKKQVYKDYRRKLKECSPEVRMLVNAAGFGRNGTFQEIARESKKLQTELPGADADDPAYAPLYEQRGQDHQHCFRGCILPSAVFRRICSYKVLCAESFPGSPHRTETGRHYRNRSMSGASRHRVLPHKRSAHGSSEKAHACKGSRCCASGTD